MSCSVLTCTMRSVKLTKCPGSNDLIALYRAGDTDHYLLGVTEFGHTYALSWYEVRNGTLSYVLEHFGTDAFDREFNRNRKAYGTSVKAERRLRRDTETNELLVDID